MYKKLGKYYDGHLIQSVQINWGKRAMNWKNQSQLSPQNPGRSLVSFLTTLCMANSLCKSSGRVPIGTPRGPDSLEFTDFLEFSPRLGRGQLWTPEHLLAAKTLSGMGELQQALPNLPCPDRGSRRQTLVHRYLLHCFIHESCFLCP